MKNKKRFVKLVTVMLAIGMVVGGLLLLDDVDGLNLSTQNVEAAETVASGSQVTRVGTYTKYDWVLDSEGTMTISGFGCVQFTGNGWDDYKSDVVSVVIEEGMTKIGCYAFSEFNNLTSIEIPTSVNTIEYDAFYGCSSLTSINIPNDETSIGMYAFCGCTSLTSIELPYGMTDIKAGTFYNCSSLSNITMPDNVGGIGNEAFYGCSSLSSIELNNVTSIGDYAFYGCSSLTSIELPENFSNIGSYAFAECTALSFITHKGATDLFLNSYYVDFMLDSVTSLGNYAFYNCDFYSVALTDSLSGLGLNTFDKQDDNLTIYYAGSKSEWDKYSFNSSNITVYYLTDFTLGDDNNSFIHGNKREYFGFYGISNYDMGDVFYNELAQYASFGEKYQILKQMHTAGVWEGSCYGVASTMGLLYDGIIDILDLSDLVAPSYYDMEVPCDNEKLLNNIQFYQLSQYISAFSSSNIAESQTASGSFTRRWNGWDDEETFWETLIEYSLEGKVLLFGYTHSTEKGKSGHTVLVTGCAYDAVNEEYRIQIYDENTVLSSGDIGSFAEICVSKDFSNCNFEYISTWFAEISELSSLAKSITTETRNITLVRFGLSPTFDITNSAGESISYDGTSLSGDMEISSFDTVLNDTTDGEGDSSYILGLDSSDSYEISCLSDEIDIDLYDSDEYISLYGNGIDSATISLDEGINIRGTDYDFTVFISADTETDDEIGLVSISATATDDVSILRDGEYIIVTSEGDLQDIVVANYDAEDMNEVSLETTTSKLTLSGTDEGVVVADLTVLGDVNLDGDIDYLDAMTVLRADAELIELTDEQSAAGDVNGDGSVDSLDAILILRYDAGLIENF